jgi:hypothetical protein
LGFASHGSGGGGRDMMMGPPGGTMGPPGGTMGPPGGTMGPPGGTMGPPGGTMGPEMLMGPMHQGMMM